MGQDDTTAIAQLYLVLAMAACAQPAERLGVLLAETQVPSLLIIPDPSQPDSLDTLRSLVVGLQQHGTAVLVADDPEAARALRADGVHLTAGGSEMPMTARYDAARKTLGNEAIIGVDVGQSRHDAMVLGEAGANYVAFAGRARPEAETARDAQLQCVNWWAEIFEIPVVALDVGDDETARQFARTGADFVARAIPAGKSAADLLEWLRKAKAALYVEDSSD